MADAPVAAGTANIFGIEMLEQKGAYAYRPDAGDPWLAAPAAGDDDPADDPAGHPVVDGPDGRRVNFELAASGRALVVDLDQVSFIDSSGLAALVGAARRAAAHGASLQVICTRPRTRQLFRLTGLNGQVPLARTLDGALQSRAAARHAPAS